MSTGSKFRWGVCALLFAASGLSFLDRQVLSVLAPAITSEFGMSNTAYSRVVFSFALSYTLMFTLGGRLMDITGTRAGLALSVALWSLASAAHALTTGFLGLAAARFLLGFGEGACFPAATKAAVEWFPKERRALAIGLATGGSAFGAVVAPPLTALVTLHFGWRGAFVATGLLGAGWLAAWTLALRPGHAPVADTRPAPPTPWRTLFRNPLIGRILAARFLFDPVLYFYLYWIPQYLASERGLSLAQIGSLLWIPFLVLGVATIAWGRFSDFFVARYGGPLAARPKLLGAAAVLTAFSAFTFFAASPVAAIGWMSLLMLAHGLWIGNFLAYLGDRFPVSDIATVSGLTGTAGGIGGMLSSLAIGAVVDRFSYGPVFLVSAALYPLAAAVLFARRHNRTSS